MQFCLGSLFKESSAAEFREVKESFSYISDHTHLKGNVYHFSVD